MKQRMKLSAFAKSQGITYQSAWKMWAQGMIEGIKLESGTILVSGWARAATEQPRVLIYARVNDPSRTQELHRQIEAAENYCEERDYEVVEVVKEVVQGVNFDRPKLLQVLKRDNWDIIVVEDQRIISPFAYDLLEAALGAERTVESINQVEVDKDALAKLFQNILVWMKQIYGQGGHKKRILEGMSTINY